MVKLCHITLRGPIFKRQCRKQKIKKHLKVSMPMTGPRK